MYRISKKVLVTEILIEYPTGDVLATVGTKFGTYNTLINGKDIPGYEPKEPIKPTITINNYTLPPPSKKAKRKKKKDARL